MTGRCNGLPKKVPKRIIQKKRQQQIRDEHVSFIISFICWVQQQFHGWGSFSWIHWNGWIPQLRCQKYVNRFMHVFVLIWYFGLPKGLVFYWNVCQSPIRVSLLFICGSFIFQHTVDREMAATGWKGLTNATSKDVCVVPRHVSNDGVNTLVTAWKRKDACSPLSRGCLFFFTHASSLFR